MVDDGGGCCSLVSGSRYMRPEGPWRLAATIDTDFRFPHSPQSRTGFNKGRFWGYKTNDYGWCSRCVSNQKLYTTREGPVLPPLPPCLPPPHHTPSKSTLLVLMHQTLVSLRKTSTSRNFLLPKPLDQRGSCVLPRTPSLYLSTVF